MRRDPVGRGVQSETSNDERFLFIVAGFILYSSALGRRQVG
ncbi:hypothetical protein [Lentilactobacillus sunkii]|nr:hypothetical protein [Lentilactobacillus sunkii]